MKRVCILLVTIVMLYLPSVAYGITVLDFTQMLQNLQSTMPNLMRFVTGFCYVMGLWLILKGVYKLKRYGQMRTMMAANLSIAKPLIVMLVGAGLIYLPGVIDVGIETLWAQGSSSVLSYPTGSGSWEAFINPLIDVVRLFGFIAFVRGWMILAKFGAEQAQPGTGGKAIMHMMGGLLAMNIVGTWDVIKATFGIG